MPPEHASAPQPPPTPGSRSALGLVVLILLVDAAGFSIVFPLFPSMLRYYLEHASGDAARSLYATLAGWVGESPGSGGRATDVLFGGVLTAAYAGLQFLFAPLWGALSDRYGRRPVLLVTCAGTAAAAILWIFAGSFAALLASRVLAGAMAGNLAVARAVIADVTPPSRRAQGMGLFGAALGIGFITGPLLGLAFGPGSGLHAPAGTLAFHPFSGAATASAVLAVLNLVGVALLFRETLAPAVRATAVRWRDRIGVLGITRVGDPRLQRTFAAYLVYSLAFTAMEATLAFLADQRFGMSIRQVGLLQAYAGVMIIITQGGLVRRFVPRWGEVRCARGGIAVAALGLLVLGIAPSPNLLYLGLGLCAVGAGFANTSLATLTSLYAEASGQGGASGVFGSLAALARAIGPVVAGLLFWWWGSTTNYLAAAAFAALAAGIAWTLPQPAKRT